MKLRRFLFAFLLSLAAVQFCFPQEIDFENGNWFREIKGYDDYYTSYDFKLYTKDDVVKAKRKFNFLKQFSIKDEWEGIYVDNVEWGAAELHWNATGGFLYYYVYHTLSKLDFGSVLNKENSVKLISEKSPNSKRKSIFSTISVKVKFGDKHFLVRENHLREFVERAMGLDVGASGYADYLYKQNESDNKIFGLPILPEKYRSFLRLPINTKIINVGKRQLHQNKFQDGQVYSEESHRFVTLRGGRNKKIKVGMFFFVKDLDDWVEITKVLSKSSIGKITRRLDETKQEQCRVDSNDGQGEIIPCKEIKVGMMARTKVSKSLF